MQGAGDGDGVGDIGRGARIEDVVDGAQVGVRGGGQVTGQQVGEGKGVGARLEAIGFGQEGPGEEHGDFGGAVGAVLHDRSLGQDVGGEGHGEGVQGDGGVGDGQEELTGEEGARGLGRGAVEDERGRLHVDDELGRFGGTDFGTVLGRGFVGGGRGAAGEAEALALLLGVEDVHGGFRVPAPAHSSLLVVGHDVVVVGGWRIGFDGVVWMWVWVSKGQVQRACAVEGGLGHGGDGSDWRRRAGAI